MCCTPTHSHDYARYNPKGWEVREEVCLQCGNSQVSPEWEKRGKRSQALYNMTLRFIRSQDHKGFQDDQKSSVAAHAARTTAKKMLADALDEAGGYPDENQLEQIARHHDMDPMRYQDMENAAVTAAEAAFKATFEQGLIARREQPPETQELVDRATSAAATSAMALALTETYLAILKAASGKTLSGAARVDQVARARNRDLADRVIPKAELKLRDMAGFAMFTEMDRSEQLEAAAREQTQNQGPGTAR